MVLSQEIQSGICQLRWPRFQSTQIQLLKQFLLPLFHRQLWCLEVSSNTSIIWVCIGGSDTQVVATALATGVFFLRVWRYAYYFSLPQQHSCCHCTTLYKHSVLLGPGVMIHLQHIGLESSHLAPCQCELSPSSHV